MEPSLRTRKRKQPSSRSDPLSGVFTRSRSQIYFHHNRSGCSRPDSNRVRGVKDLCKSVKDSNLGRPELAKVSVIDLRARRVFSPASIDGGEDIGGCKKKDCVLEDGCDNIIVDDVVLDLGGGGEGDLEDGCDNIVDVIKGDDGDVVLSVCDVGLDHGGEFDGCKKMGGVEGVLEDRCDNIIDVIKGGDDDVVGSVGDVDYDVCKKMDGVEGDLEDGCDNIVDDVVVQMTQSVVENEGNERAEGVLEDGSENIIDDDVVQMTQSVVESEGFEMVEGDLEAGCENIGVIDGDEDVVVKLTQTVVEAEENEKIEEKNKKNEMVSVASEVVDTKGVMVKNQASVTSLRGRRKIYKSPSSFSYRRLLPYLTDLGNDDSSNFEMVDVTLPKVPKSSSTWTNLAVCKDEEIGNSSKVTNGLLNNAKCCEKQISNSLNGGLSGVIETSDAVQKSQEGVLNDTLEECVQMTPPDSDILSKSKIDDTRGVLVNPKLKPALKSCSRNKVLQIPTSFSHRRLLPFLMSVAEDSSCPLKGNQSLKLVKSIEQNQQPPTQALSHQDEKLTTAVETSNSPTSTLVPVDTLVDTTKSVTLAPNNSILDDNQPDKEDIGLISHLEVNIQDEAVKSDGCIQLEHSPPKVSLKCVEETTFKATPPCTEKSYNEDHQITLKESPPKRLMQISETTPPCIEQSYNEDHQITLKESPPECLLQISETTPPCIEQSYNEDHQITVKESPPKHMSQVFETHGENIKSGILKKTPRGCRGICNCLNCTSFRLHADRSFEFSKNQMHDAEEVALELINDLTHLRNILETTSSSNSLDTVKEKQVKEACANALYKEQVARARLAQMNEDLSFHCRNMNSSRPKVTFANKIEEKAIPKNVKYGRKRV